MHFGSTDTNIFSGTSSTPFSAVAALQDRSPDRIEPEDWARLSELALLCLNDPTVKRQVPSVYRARLKLLCVSEGDLLFQQNKRDQQRPIVWAFYQEIEGRPIPLRVAGPWEFGPPLSRYDIRARTIHLEPHEGAVSALRRYLAESKTNTAAKLAKLPLRVISDGEDFGALAWPVR